MIIRCPECGGNMKYESFFEEPELDGFYCCNYNCDHKELDKDGRDENGNMREEWINYQFIREV